VDPPLNGVPHGFKMSVIVSKLISLNSVPSIRNWMNLRDADTGKILWQNNDDMYVLFSCVRFQMHICASQGIVCKVCCVLP